MSANLFTVAELSDTNLVLKTLEKKKLLPVVSHYSSHLQNDWEPLLRNPY